MASLTETSSFPFGDWIFPSTYWSPTWPLREVPEPAIIIPLEWIFSSSASPTEDRPKSYFQIPITDVSILNVLVTGLNLNHKTKTHYYCCLNSRGTYTLSGSRPLAGTPTWPGCPWPARWSRSKTAMPSSSPAASLHGQPLEQLCQPGTKAKLRGLPPCPSRARLPASHQWALQGGTEAALKGLGLGCLQAGGDRGPALILAPLTLRRWRWSSGTGAGAQVCLAHTATEAFHRHSPSTAPPAIPGCPHRPTSSPSSPEGAASVAGAGRPQTPRAQPAYIETTTSSTRGLSTDVVCSWLGGPRPLPRPVPAHARPALSRGPQQHLSRQPQPTAAWGPEPGIGHSLWRSRSLVGPNLLPWGRRLFIRESSPRTASSHEQAAGFHPVSPAQVHVCPALTGYPTEGVYSILQLFNNKLPSLLKALSLLPKWRYSDPSQQTPPVCVCWLQVPDVTRGCEGHLPSPARPPCRDQTKLAWVSKQ